MKFIVLNQGYVKRESREGGGYQATKMKRFSGLFVDYHWTECAFYTVGGIVAVVVFALAKGRKEETSDGK